MNNETMQGKYYVHARAPVCNNISFKKSIILPSRSRLVSERVSEFHSDTDTESLGILPRLSDSDTDTDSANTSDKQTVLVTINYHSRKGTC